MPVAAKTPKKLKDLCNKEKRFKIYKLSDELTKLKAILNNQGYGVTYNYNQVIWLDTINYNQNIGKPMSCLKNVEFHIKEIRPHSYDAVGDYFVKIEVLNPKNFESGRDTASIRMKQAEVEALLNCCTGQDIFSSPHTNKKVVLARILAGRTGLEFGSDPEIFVEGGNEKVIPAWEYLPNPVPVQKMPNGVAQQKVFWDGLQAEFTTDSNRCLAWVMDSIQQGLSTTIKEARKYDKNAQLSTKTVTKLSRAQMKRFDPQYLEFGCNPVVNAYGLEPVRPKDGLIEQYRPAGGHIHIGLYKQDMNKTKKATKEQIEKYVKSLDRILGVVSVAMFYKFDRKERRELYGLAGEYRTPAHGLEYRTLSNAWLQHPVLANTCFELARLAITLVQYDIESLWKGVDEKETIRIIQENDYIAARRVVRANKEILQAIAKMCIMVNADRNDTTTERENIIYKLAVCGAHNFLAEDHTIEDAWNIDGAWRSHCDGIGKNIREASRTFATKGLI